MSSHEAPDQRRPNARAAPHAHARPHAHVRSHTELQRYRWVEHHGADLDEDGEDDLGEEQNPDELQITSIGVDIGSATSHLMVSRLTMRRLGKLMSSRYVVVGREQLYHSPVLLTPYRADGLIDAGALERFVRRSYDESGLRYEDIDSGVVLLTGEALRRENSRAIADLLADETGRFVCASAGHHLESRVAAHGAGTVAASREGGGRRLLNLDIGGGTAKLALVENGEVLATAAVNVGGRLVATDESGVVTRLEPAGEWAAAAAGVELAAGRVVSSAELESIAVRLADCLAEVLAEGARSPLTERLLLTEQVAGTRDVDAVVLSGGVSEYLAGDPPGFGDLAAPLAGALAAHLAGLYGERVTVSPAGLRATVVGLSQFTVEASGDTIYAIPTSVLPLRNVPIVKLALPDDLAGADIGEAVAQAAKARDLVPGELAGVAVHWNGVPRYPALVALASGLSGLLGEQVAGGHPAVVVVGLDCAKSLGHVLHEQLGPSAAVVCIDGLELGELDYIDIGGFVTGKTVVPVVVKSLLFGAAPAR